VTSVHTTTENRLTCPRCGRFLASIKGDVYGVAHIDMNCAHCQRNHRHGAARDGKVELVIVLLPPAKLHRKRRDVVECEQLTLPF
jgi:hypothetical protein